MSNSKTKVKKVTGYQTTDCKVWPDLTTAEAAQKQLDFEAAVDEFCDEEFGTSVMDHYNGASISRILREKADKLRDIFKIIQ